MVARPKEPGAKRTKRTKRTGVGRRANAAVRAATEGIGCAWITVQEIYEHVYADDALRPWREEGGPSQEAWKSEIRSALSRNGACVCARGGGLRAKIPPPCTILTTRFAYFDNRVAEIYTKGRCPRGRAAWKREDYDPPGILSQAETAQLPRPAPTRARAPIAPEPNGGQWMVAGRTGILSQAETAQLPNGGLPSHQELAQWMVAGRTALLSDEGVARMLALVSM
jgi:hypothetical protein